MNLKDAYKLIIDFEERPKKAILEVLVLLLLAGIIPYIYAYCGEKGKQHAMSPNINVSTAIVPKEAQPVKKTNSDNKVTIHQTTRGSQSPAIISEGSVTIKYNTNKDKNKKE